jgi:hypothetical protein
MAELRHASSLARSIFSGEAIHGRADAVGELLTELRAELTAQIDALRRLIEIADMKTPMIRLAFALLLAMIPFGAGADQWLFVSPKGSDQGQCESIVPALQSVERAAWPTVTPTASPRSL